MNPPDSDDLSRLSMLELFRLEADNQTAVLTGGLLDLERGAGPHSFEVLMRAAHSLKGAARIVNLQVAVQLAHSMEDCFVAAHGGKVPLGRREIDLLLQGVDLLMHLAKQPDSRLETWERDHAGQIEDFLGSLARLKSGPGGVSGPVSQAGLPEAAAPFTGPMQEHPSTAAHLQEIAPWLDAGSPGRTRTPAGQHALAVRKHEPAERFLRLTAENLNRLLGLAGESLVESRWLRPFADSLQRLKRHHVDLARTLGLLRQALEQDQLSDRTAAYLNDLFRQVGDSQQFLAERVQELDVFDRRAAHLSQRLYLEVLRTRMRPFSDGVRRFPRMVRDLARSLDKQIKLEIGGELTQVDRDILERLETPLAHLLRNAVDHGCEPPEARRHAGKPAEAIIRLEARHSAGVLLVTVSDDGAGVDLETVRAAIIDKGLTAPGVAEKLTESELLEFLFLPGFTLKDIVTEVSGRGFGLDIVQNMVKSVRGAIRLNNQPGRGLRVQLQLPLTLSVLRALLVEVAGEPYAIPLSQITQAVKVPRRKVQALEGRPHFNFSDQQVGLLTAHQVLECSEPPPPGAELPVVVLSDRNTRYGLVVDRFLGERELVVQPLDPCLGKIKDISAAALMEDGGPVLIIDVEDMIRSVEKLIAEGRLAKGQSHSLHLASQTAKRVLAVDDSLTVRELERKLLTSRGYLADVAVDGMEAWEAVRTGHYDLVITDIDMPHLDGIELTTLIKKEPRLKSLPVLIVSYKDREEDRLRGLEAGADYYLTKGSFHDETLLQAVMDLIGEPDS
ncbi:MAG TPA: hybrid sensor histidine kinase/response regulator [Candidatus Binatia bacterium]|nr:hybrid sensor histidine kinase/response regulator [Candidatus Binatia bacterium]